MFATLFCIMFCLTCVRAIKDGKYDTVAMSGVIFEEQEIDLYDSMAAILFDVPKPEWLQQFPFFMGYPCNTDKYAEASLCPIFYYLTKQLSLQLEAAMDDPTQHIPMTDMEVKFECGQLSKHFPTLSLTENRMDEYIDKLLKCTGGRMVKDTLAPDGTSFRQVYDTMVRRFMEEFHNRLPTTNRENKASELNHRLGMTSMAVTHLLALKDQWSNALSECKGGFIPESLVTPEKLRGLLDKLEVEAGGANYKLVLPQSGPQISRYYKAPLADCVLTEEKLFIRILVPVVLKRLTPSNLIRIRSVPFHTQTDEHQICTIRGFQRGRYFNLGVEKVGSVATSLAVEITSCDPHRHQMCRIPDPVNTVLDSDTDCARSIISYEFEATDENKMNMVDVCKLDCTAFDTEKFPVVIRSKDALGTIYVMMNPDNEEGLFMDCEKKDDSLTIKVPTTGILGLTLPCRCKLVFKSRTVLPDPSTCKDYYIANAVPFHWEGRNSLAK